MVRAAARRLLEALSTSMAFGSSAGAVPGGAAGGAESAGAGAEGIPGGCWALTPATTSRLSATRSVRAQTKSCLIIASASEPTRRRARRTSWDHTALEHLVGDRRRNLADERGSHLGVAREDLLPGWQSNLLHYHMLEEEHVFILEGELTLRLGDKSYVMKAGDHVCFPAGQQVGHCLVNHTDKVCRYLLIGERNPHDICVYPETGRVGVRLMGEGYRRAATMKYWEDAP